MKRSQFSQTFHFRLLLTLIALAVSLASIDNSFAISAHREENETEEEAAARNWRDSQSASPYGTTAHALRGPLNVARIMSVPEWPDAKAMSASYFRLRDDRFLTVRRNPEFRRRISWLYPDDGCYVRADLARRKLIEYGYPAPAKLFAFGTLRTKTPYHPRGKVTWWFHVVVAYRIGRQVIVLDPSIESRRPLLVEEWATLMGGSVKKFRFSVCDSNAYSPYSACVGSRGNRESATYSSQYHYLDLEWKRMKSLKRVPEKILGDSPPWKDPLILLPMVHFSRVAI